VEKSGYTFVCIEEGCRTVGLKLTGQKASLAAPLVRSQAAVAVRCSSGDAAQLEHPKLPVLAFDAALLLLHCCCNNTLHP
jgi:hypothetical protein